MQRPTEPGHTATAEMVEWLRGLLADEKTIDRRNAILAAGRDEFAERTIYRTRRKLGLVVEQSGFGREKQSI